MQEWASEIFISNFHRGDFLQLYIDCIPSKSLIDLMEYILLLRHMGVVYFCSVSSETVFDGVFL
jgi:hypothetical protein